MQGKCEYPGCTEPATIACCMIGCSHRVCETHGNGGIEEAGEQFFPLCWGCDGKGWGDEPQIGTLKYGYQEWVRGLPPMPAPADAEE